MGLFGRKRDKIAERVSNARQRATNVKTIEAVKVGVTETKEDPVKKFSDLALDDKEAGILATSMGQQFSEEKRAITAKYFGNKLDNKKYLKLKVQLVEKYMPLAVREKRDFMRGLVLSRRAQGTIIVVSDAHANQTWREEAPALLDFLDYIKTSRPDVSDIVMLGDMFDFQRGLHSLAESDIWALWGEIISLHEKGPIRLHYIYGNHDYNLFPMTIGKIKLPGSDFFPFSAKDKMTLVLKSGGKKILFFHGHELESYPMWFYEPTSRLGTAAGMWGPAIEASYNMIDFVVGKVKKKNLSETALNREEYIKFGEGLKGYHLVVHGHTELPYIDGKVACPGSWNIRTDGVRTFMEIRDGGVEIKQYINRNHIITLPESVLSDPRKPDKEFIEKSIAEEKQRWGDRLHVLFPSQSKRPEEAGIDVEKAELEAEKAELEALKEGIKQEPEHEKEELEGLKKSLKKLKKR